MWSRSSFGSVPASLLVLAFVGMTPAADAASAALALSRPGPDAGALVAGIAHRGRVRPLYVPIAPNYLAYDYPYYYRRGFYPRHIGRGYVYYGSPYSYYRKIYRGRCSHRHRSCVRRRAVGSRREVCRCR